MRRGQGSMGQYLSMHQMAFDDAVEQGGLALNNIGRTYFLLRGAKLRAANLRLQDARISRFQQISGYCCPDTENVYLK